MTKIILLDENTIGKIAAGEVVERPSSIIKELVENSLDADSKNITIEIKNGGKTHIRITDDGHGISNNDIDLAFKRHSTSKLSTTEDLFRIRTLGFRGEALASISQVAKVEVMTRTIDNLSGIHAIIENGEIISKEVIGCPIGTTMIVKDLFYNLPVRREFLRSDLIEGNHISDIVYKIAIGNRNTSFKFIKDDRVVLKTSRNNDMKSHIYSILGKEFSNNMLEINHEDKDIKIYGYISNNNLYRSNRNHQYIYINGRYISNASISNIIEDNYKTLIPINRYPCFILFIDLDPSVIDVNIHPTKQEVKFSNQSYLMDIIYQVCKETLHPALIVHKMKLSKESRIREKEDLPFLFDMPLDSEQKYPLDKKLAEDYQMDLVVKDYTVKTEENHIYDNSYKEEIIESTFEIELKDEHIKKILPNIKPIDIIFNTYILGIDAVSEKLYFIDQHAAHERVMYEKYLNEYRNEKISVQQLLAPEIIDLTNREMEIFLDNLELFNSLGFDVNEFGNKGIALRGVPLVFGKPNVRDLFYDVLDNIGTVKSSYDTKLEKIMKIACTNSVKGGDKLTELEVFSLIEQLRQVENPNTCPHGRPIILEITKQDIEKEFLRIN